ncbi:hypothetical protein FRB95_009853 [Tulasnella sp. JGI-2019a]|nr:hypothetical protein FRB95_009853 [Tulasnella sp. JGI-2019a]
MPHSAPSPTSRTTPTQNASTPFSVPSNSNCAPESIYGKAFELLDDGQLVEYTTELFQTKLRLGPQPTTPPITRVPDRPVPIHPFFRQKSTRPSRSTNTSLPSSAEEEDMPKASLLSTASLDNRLAPMHRPTSRSTSSGRSSSSSTSRSKGTTRPSRPATEVLKVLNNPHPQGASGDLNANPIPNVDVEEKREMATSTVPAECDASDLPLYSFRDAEFATGVRAEGPRVKPALVYVTGTEETTDMVGCLQSPLGFDMEWKPQMVRGKRENKTALIQLADNNMILLIQVSQMSEFPSSLKTLIEDPAIIKAGVNIRGDRGKLERDFGIHAKGIVELDSLARKVDESNINLTKGAKGRTTLQSMVNMYCRRSLDKGKVRMSNWEKSPLNECQRDYAANDAHSGLVVYNRLMAIAAEKEKVIDLAAITDEPYLVKPAGVPKKAETVSTVVEGADTLVESVKSASTDKSEPTESLAVSTPTCPPGVRPQHYRAYYLWHESELSLDAVCAELRTPPLARSTIISYVVEALKGSHVLLPFSRIRLVELAKMESRSWVYHRKWIESLPSMDTHIVADIDS